MKRYEFTGLLDYYRPLNCSYYGNPAFYAEFVNDQGDILEGRTASNADCAYGFLNSRNKPRKITYHITKKGNVIFDYIRILEEENNHYEALYLQRG